MEVGTINKKCILSNVLVAFTSHKIRKMKVIFLIVSALVFVAVSANPIDDGGVEGVLDPGYDERDAILDIGIFPWEGIVDTGSNERDGILEDGVKVFEHVGILDDGSNPWSSHVQ